MANAGWYTDPTGRYASRYWDGQQWTNQVNSGGANTADEPPDDMRYVAPAPGTERESAQSPAPVHVTQQAPRSSAGTVVAVVLGVIAIIVVIALLINNGDSTDTPTTEAPAPTEAPATTAAP